MRYRGSKIRTKKQTWRTDRPENVIASPTIMTMSAVISVLRIWRIFQEILYTNIIKIFHLTLCIFLHYFVKFDFTIAIDFKMDMMVPRVVCEISEFILQNMRTF